MLVDPATVRITAKVAATVDAEGRHTAARPGSTVTADIKLESVNGQWRIAELPEGFGRWIASTEVNRLVRPYAVHYVSTSRRALIPDVRWFPVDRLATRLARAQILPLPEHLTGAAVTAVPNGARLLGDAVSIDAGVATVNLISSKLAPGQTTRQNLWAQFVATLIQDPAVTRVALSVDDVPVNLLTLDGSAGTLAEVGFTPLPPVVLAAPVVRRGDEVVVFDPNSLGDQEPRQPAGQRAYPSVPVGFSRLALSADGSELAAVDPGGCRHLPVARREPLRGAARRRRRGQPVLRRPRLPVDGGDRVAGRPGAAAVRRRHHRRPRGSRRGRRPGRGPVARRAQGARSARGPGR